MVSKTDAIEIITYAEENDINIWIDGGWGVDALLEEETRVHNDIDLFVEEIYDFETGCVKTECMSAGWQTSGSLKIIRMAFNLYCNGTPTVYEKEGVEGKLKECEHYTVEDLFCCEYAPYFWQAIQLRYPEYCGM